MKFGVRQCANIVFRAKQETVIGTSHFHVGQPVLYIDTATTSSMEQASSSVYAQGGRGNARLIAWQGDKTLTFTVTDALISPLSLSMLSGAGLVKEAGQRVHVHATTAATMIVSGGAGTIDLTEALVEFGSLTGDEFLLMLVLMLLFLLLELKMMVLLQEILLFLVQLHLEFLILIIQKQEKQY